MTVDPLLLRPILMASLIRTSAHHRSTFGSSDPLALTVAVNAMVDRIMADLKQLGKQDGTAGGQARVDHRVAGRRFLARRGMQGSEVVLALTPFVVLAGLAGLAVFALSFFRPA